MASEKTTLLFDRSNVQDDSDVWDDTALIKAYDKTISKMKREIEKQINSTTETDYTDNERKPKKSPNKKEKKSKDKHKQKENSDEDNESFNKSTSTITKEWKVGDNCMAIFSEDGLLYPGEIIELMENEGKCIVKYEYYGNEEEKLLSELYEPQTLDESNSEYTTKTEQETDKEHKKKKVKKEKKKKAEKFEQPSFEIPQFASSLPIPPPPPPIPQSLLANLQNLSLSESDQNIKVDQNEAFYSMLMAWYMSGYHTGYYFGLLESKKDEKPSNK